MNLDDDGNIWVFANSHGGLGVGQVYRSSTPYEITDFDEVALPGTVFGDGTGDNALAYSNSNYVPGEGFLLVWNKYNEGRSVHAATSTDGTTWLNGRNGTATSDKVIDIDGHYQMSRQVGNTVGIVSNVHHGGLNNRTNLYYIESNDFGDSWNTAQGTTVSGAVTDIADVSLIYDYESENKLVYMMDLNYDAQGKPIVLYLTVSDANSSGHVPGPDAGPRTVHTAHWTGVDWAINDVVTTDHNYDHGELYIEDDGSWCVIAPFIDGPQEYGTGGEVGLWRSTDEGDNWKLVQQLTDASEYNHTYVRRPHNAADGFYAYWADGDSFEESNSRFYFSNKNGTVFRMPTDFDGDFAAPIYVSDAINFVPEPASYIIAIVLALCCTVFRCRETALVTSRCDA